MTFTRRSVFLMALLVLGSTAPADADPELELTVDGVTCGSDLTVPLFDPDIRWVPGDTRSATFQVRNSSGDPARLSVDILGTAVDTLLDTGRLSVSARGGGSPWQAISTPGTHRLVSAVKVGPGASSPIDVVVAFSPAASRQSMRQDLDLRFRLRLTQMASAGDTGVVDLPDTGGLPAQFLLLGAALAVAGIHQITRTSRKGLTHA